MRPTSYMKAFFASIFCIFMLCSGTVLANSGGKEASGASSTVPLEPFVVNLSSFDRYLQVSVALQLAAPELGEKIKTIMPIIRHSMLMVLSSKESSQIQSADGKHELIDEIKNTLNKVLDVKEHDGVTDVYFVNFVIQ